MSVTSDPRATASSLGLPTPIAPAASPFLPRHLLDLFLRPRQFFSGQLALGKTPHVLLVTWCYGIASAIERIDQELVRAQLGQSRPGWEQIAPYVTGSWLGFWVWAFGLGVIGATFLWYVGGWWYSVRLRWCGAANHDKRLARLAFTYSAFVVSAPTILAAAVQTAIYPSYAAAFSAEELYSLVLLVFPFWALATSYAGATELFEVRRGRAITWFLALPAVLYMIVFGALAALVAFVGGAQ